MPYKINYSVYKITNTTTNQYYIGVDSYFPKRLKQHKSMLLRNKHKNKHLQYSWNKYGADSFTFELICSCRTREDMLEKEIFLIKKHNSILSGFNKTSGGEGSHGYKHTKESLQKMSSWKRVITPEWRQSISKANKGKKRTYKVKRINHPDYSRWVGGEKHPVAKLSFQEVCIIRLMYLEGKCQLDIAKKFSVSKTMVNLIVTHVNWKDEYYKYIPKREFHTEQYNNLKQYLCHVIV